MGLNDIHKFSPEEKIIEYVMAEKRKHRLVDMNLKAFMNETASDSPAPGGGSISSYIGALGVALGTMVANLSSHKRGWDDRWEEFSKWAEKGKAIQNRLLNLVDEDTDAYNKILEASGLPKRTDEEKAIRINAIQEATKHATLIPFTVMGTAFEGFELLREMVEKGNPNSVTDAAVGVLALRSCIRGAFLNVKINASGLSDKSFVNEILLKASTIESKTIEAEISILKIVDSRLNLMST
jgi:glutamate formiminotransferase/formiminotetrahydrofolate cyclodeaminase